MIHHTSTSPVGKPPPEVSGGITLLDRLRAQGRSLSAPHLDDLPGLFQRLADRSRLEFEAFCRNHPELADDDDPQPVKRTRQRKPTLAGVVRQTTKAGVEVARYDVRPDGTISVVPGKPVGDIDMDDTTSSDPRWN